MPREAFVIYQPPKLVQQLCGGATAAAKNEAAAVLLESGGLQSALFGSAGDAREARKPVQ